MTGHPPRGAVLATALTLLATSAAAQVGPRDVTEDALFAAAASRPSECRTIAFGRTAGGRPLRAILVGRPGAVPLEERPRLVIVAGLDADQAASALIAGRLPAVLLDLAAADPATARIMEEVAVEVIPALALDAFAAAASGPTTSRRRNARPTDEDRDGLLDEDGPEDLDGDGVVAVMRVPDPLGPWRASDEDPRLLAKADPKKGERGTWRLESEGVDDDGDGRLNEDPVGGVAFDRNFPHGWKEFEPDAGRTAISEPETRALIDRLLATKPCVAVLVLGARDGLVEAPPGKDDGAFFPAVESEDRPWFEALVARRKERLGFERKLEDAADGAVHQWAYAQLGVLGLASKAYEAPKPEAAASLPTGKKAESDDARRLLDADRRLGGRGFVPWKAFKHPTLGDVEIGGFVPNAYESPTAEEIPALTERHARFASDVAAAFPKIELVDVAAKALGGGLHELTAVVRNVGRIPDVLRVARRTRTVLPSRAEVDLPRDRFELGEPSTALEPFGPAGGGRKLRWIVRAKAGETTTVRVRTEKAGTASATATFGEEPR